MRTLLHCVWHIISFPLRVVTWVISRPLKAIKRVRTFLTFEPEGQSLGDAFVKSIQQPSALLEHLDALRKHIFRMLIAIVVGLVICGTFTGRIINLLATPIGGISKLQAIDPTETIGVFMKVALLGGFSLATPYIAFELWLFAAPGLMAKPRRMSLIAIPMTLIFFLGGMYFAYRFMLPAALPFLLNFMEINTIPRVSSYVGFVTSLIFWVGIAFEFPLVVFVLTYMGFVKPGMLIKQWRVAVVLMAVLAAAITPTVDPVNMGLMMAPMIVLYFLSIGLSQVAIIGRGRVDTRDILNKKEA